MPEARSLTAQAVPGSFQTNPGYGGDDLFLKFSLCAGPFICIARLGQTWDNHSKKLCGAPHSTAQEIYINYFLIMIRRAQNLLSHRTSVVPQKNSRVSFTSAALFLYERLKAKLEK